MIRDGGGLVMVIVAFMLTLLLVLATVHECMQEDRAHQERMLIIKDALGDTNIRVDYDEKNQTVVLTDRGPDGLFGTEDDTVRTFQGHEDPRPQPQTQGE